MGIIEAMSRVRGIVGADCKLVLEFDGEVCWLDISIREGYTFEDINRIASELAKESSLESKDITFSRPEEGFEARIGFEVKLDAQELDSLVRLPWLRITVPFR